MTRIADQLEKLPPSARKLLREHRFDAARFERLADDLRSSGGRDNRVTGKVAPPQRGDVVDLPSPGSAEWQRLEALGSEVLAKGQCALIVLAGGMATRMGGVVKALVDAIPGHSFLDLRLAEMASIERRTGARTPLWLMTSQATDQAIRETLGARRDGYFVETFTQYLSLRLTPEGDVFFDAQGNPSEHAPGHGDLPDALKESGLIDRFVERGGRVVMVANIDNLGATLHPALVGLHLDQGAPVTCEVVDKVGSDRGGIPVRLDDRPVVLEEFRLPRGFDPTQVRVFNTNTFFFDAEKLATLDMDWSFFTVKKQVDDTPVIQFERLIGEVTSSLDTRFVRVPRQGPSSRFLPVKDPEELEARRAEIEAVMRDRGILP